MRYLEDLQHYEDRYDLWTIEQCLDEIKMLQRVADKMTDAKEIQHLSLEEKERNINMLAGQRVKSLMLHRYKKREERLKEWIDKDRQKQDLLDNTPVPKNIKCDNCKGNMFSEFHHLTSSSDGDDDRVLFLFRCKSCKAGKGVFENGEVWEKEADLCEKCGGELDHTFKKTKKYDTWTEFCTKCDYKKVDKTDIAKEKQKRIDEENRKKELLEKYRNRFCFKKEEAEELIQALEELKFANQVYEYELQKYESPEYEQTHNLKKLSATELEELLNKDLKKRKFDRLSMKEPQFGQYVEIEFSTQDFDKSRNETESIEELKHLLTEILETTNWRLNGTVSNRLGFLMATLRGYERDEDILKSLIKSEPKQKKVALDPELEKKYGHSNAVGLAKLSAEFEGKKRLRMKRYKTEPEGFVLETHGNNYYTCNLCHRSIKGNETWWIPEAQLCFDCNRNLKDGIFPVDIFKNNKLCFRMWDIEKEFGMHNATVRKHIRNGDLVGRALKDEEGKEYYKIFMAEDNVEFFKNHPRKGERKQRWHYLDGNGEVIWL